jgi:hypothetical protein
MPGRSALVVVAALGLMLPASAVAGARAGGARCSSTVPAAHRIADDPADGSLGLAPELTGVDVGLDGACRLTVTPLLGDRSVTAGLFPREGVATYVDTDGSVSTGARAWGGADVAVVVAGRLGASAGPAIGTWTSGRFRFHRAPRLPAAGIGGFTATLDQLGVAEAVVLRLRVGTSWAGALGSYRDVAPDAGTPAAPLPVAFGTAFGVRPLAGLTA